MSTPDVRMVVHAVLRTVQGTTHHLAPVTLEVLTDRVTEAVTSLLAAYRVDVLVEAGVHYVDCQVCGAAQPVDGACGTCAFKARIAAELAARGLTNPEAGDGR